MTSSYAGTLGTPVLSTKDYFNCLMALNRKEGAITIVKANKLNVCPMEFEKGLLILRRNPIMKI